jgi:hypothetical protein
MRVITDKIQNDDPEIRGGHVAARHLMQGNVTIGRIRVCLNRRAVDEAFWLRQ